MQEQYITFDDLPHWVQEPVRKMRSGDEHAWVFQPVPALDGQSVMALMNQGDKGQRLLRAYLNTVIGKFF